MKNYEITKWEPIHGMLSQLYVESLSDDYEGLKIILKGGDISDRLLKVRFTSHLGYRNVDETYRLKTLDEHPILTEQWPLFKSIDNDFVQWMLSESYGTLDASTPYINYIICTPNDIVEIVSYEEPIVEWL